MDLSVFLILLQDGVVNAAIYALLALAMVLLFTVTRVIFVPIGEFVSFGALTLAALELGRVPGTVWLLGIFGGAAAIATLWAERRNLTARAIGAILAETVLLPALVIGLVVWLAPGKPGQVVRILLALAVTAPLGLYLYAVVYRPVAEASVLVLLIVSVALHLTLVGLGLIFFGAEGSRTAPLSDASVTLGDLLVTGQSLSVLATTAALIGALYLFFGRTLIGKALQATAVNRLGARLVGISPVFSGRFAFGLAALIATLGGILVSPVTTIYYDTGFLIGLKGFVAAIIGGLVSYPVAAGAALLVGVIESFASFFASEFKEVIVFLIIVPILLVRSRGALVLEDEGEGARIALAIVALVALAFPVLPGIPPYWITLAAGIAISAIVALGIVVLTGVANVVSFGQAMFVGFGAYTTAILTTRYGWPPLATLPVAILVTAVLAWAIGAITLRLKGHYLPVATIAWNIAFFYLAGSLDFFRRYDGIAGIPPIRLGPLDLSGGAPFYWLCAAILAALLWVTRNLLDSRTGRAIRALKGAVLAAESFGIDTGRARILAFVYAAVLAAIAGWLYAHFQRAINPSPFSINVSIDYLLMAVAGGIGQIGGAIVGAGIVTIVRDKLQDWLPALIGAQGNFEQIVFGIVLVAIFQLAPEGLWPHVRRLFGRGRAGDDGSGEAPSAELNHPSVEPGREVLVVLGLRKTFGGLVAVNDLGFAVRAGEIVGLIGPNGAGKSTSFNLVTGVLPASAGRIAFLDQDIAGWRSRKIARLGLARTFQHVKLVHGMSVLDNVMLGAHLHGRAGAAAGALRLDRAEEDTLRAKAMTALSRVGLAHEAGTTATELALGQQRLVEIARALCLEPVMLLLDEPAAGLRHAEKTELADLLREVRRSGTAVLLVEHDMDFVMGLADRLVVMNFGAELAQGRPADVQRNPAVLEAYLGSAA